MSPGGVPGNEKARTVRQEIASWLRERRESLEISQEDLRRRLARRGIRITQSTLSRWEAGVTAPPADILAVLAPLLGDTLSSLEDRVSAALVRTGEMVDVGGRTVRELVEEVDRAARAGNFRRVLALLEVARDQATREETTAGEELPGIYVRLAATHLKFWHLALARDALQHLARMKEAPERIRILALLFRIELADREEDPDGFRAWRERLEQELARDDLPDDLRYFGLQTLGLFLYVCGDHEAAIGPLEEAMAGWRRLGRHVERLRTAETLLACRGLGGDGSAVEKLERVEEEARRRGFREIEARAPYLRGRILSHSGNRTEAVAVLQHAATLARHAGLVNLEFLSVYKAWRVVREAGDAEAEGRLRRRLIRLLTTVPPRLPEAVKFREEAGAPPGTGGY